MAATSNSALYFILLTLLYYTMHNNFRKLSITISFIWSMQAGLVVIELKEINTYNLLSASAKMAQIKH